MFEIATQIAGVRLTFVGTDETLFDHLRASYSGFLAPDTSDSFRIEVTTENRGTFRVGPGPSLEEDGVWARFVDRDGGELVLNRRTKTGRMKCPAWVFPGFDGPHYLSPGSHLRLLVSTELARRGGVVLHASAVEIDGCGVLFAGPSTAGKTTVSKLFPPQDVLNDELVAIRFVAPGQTMVAATPFSGEDGLLRSHRECPARLILLLQKATTTEITPVTDADAFSALMRCALLPHGHEELERRLFYTVSRLCADCTVRRMAFTTNAESVQRHVHRALAAVA